MASLQHVALPASNEAQPTPSGFPRGGQQLFPAGQGDCVGHEPVALSKSMTAKRNEARRNTFVRIMAVDGATLALRQSTRRQEKGSTS